LESNEKNTIKADENVLSAEENEFLKELIIGMSTDLLRIANSKLRSRDDSKDALQETFLAAYNNIDKLKRSNNPKGWLVNTLKFKVMHMQRAKFRYIKLLEKLELENETNEMIFMDNYYNPDLYTIITKDDYNILRLTYEEGYTVQEVADKLGINYEACKKRIQAARYKLKEEIKNYK